MDFGNTLRKTILKSDSVNILYRDLKIEEFISILSQMGNWILRNVESNNSTLNKVTK